eukprot:jgi/Botrbrau1/11991/Bobra.0115s0027.1
MVLVSANWASTTMWTCVVLAGYSVSAGTMESRSRTGKRSDTIQFKEGERQEAEMKPEEYWKQERDMLRLMAHYMIPKEELQPLGKEVKRAAWRKARKAADTCSIYILDASDVAVRVGVPRCDLHNFVIDPRKSMILPNPARLPFPLPEKPSSTQNADEMYPWKRLKGEQKDAALFV